MTRDPYLLYIADSGKKALNLKTLLFSIFFLYLPWIHEYILVQRFALKL